MIIDLLSREHRNIERLLAVLEHELEKAVRRAIESVIKRDK